MLILILIFFYVVSFSRKLKPFMVYINNYVKMEKLIPMRDGIRLFTSIYIPKDKTEKHPVLITRTPYSCAPYGENNFKPYWDSYEKEYFKESYIMVTQDVRGRWMMKALLKM